MPEDAAKGTYEDAFSIHDIRDPSLDDVAEEDAEEEAAAEEKPAEPARTPVNKPAESPAPAAPEALLQRARAAGLSAAEIGEFESAKALERTVAVIERREQARQATQPRNEAKPAAKEEEQEKEWEPDWLEGQEEKDEDGSTYKLGKAGLHRSVVNAVESIHKHYKERTDKLHEAVLFLLQERNQAKSADMRTKLDELFSEITEDYGEVLGDGPSDKLGQDSAPYQARAAVARMMDRLEQLRQEDGLPKLDARELRNLAVRLVHGEPKKKAAGGSREAPPARPTPPRDEQTGQFTRSREVSRPNPRRAPAESLDVEDFLDKSEALASKQLL